MSSLRRWLRTPFAAALAGGLVVACAGLVAISAGWIEAEGGEDEAALPLSRSSNGGNGLSVRDIYRRDAPGVVFIEAEAISREESPFELFPQQRRDRATGSGFVLDRDGYVLTNAHVVAGAESIRVGFTDGKSARARRVGLDPSNDLALLKVEVDEDLLHPLSLGNSKDVRVGDPVVAIGNPFGLDRTVTSGIVSALQRRIEAPNGFSITDVIQTDAAVNPGNSGGPLIDARGEVIGINSQIATAGGGGSVGIGFAVPSSTARESIEALKKDGRVEHAFLGITGADITSEIAEDLNLPVDEGVLVQRVVEDGPADEAGIRGGRTPATVGGQEILLGGDIIMRVQGRRVRGMDQVVDFVDDRKPSQRLRLDVRRGRDRRTVTVRLGSRPERPVRSDRP